MKTLKLFAQAVITGSVIFLSLAPGSAAEDNLRVTPVVKVVQNTAASVVNISTENVVLLRQDPFWGGYGTDLDAIFEQFYGRHSSVVSAYKLKSVGSGIIVDKSGLIATNAHVVNRASSIFIILNDGTQAEGKLAYENKKDDIALVKITPPKPLTEVRLGQTKDLMLGETVVAIGNPLGLENSVSAGVISGKNRKLYTQRGELICDGLLQIDAPINSGNSGGALFNLNSELIGINVALVEYSQNIGFTVPVEKLRESLTAYKSNKGAPAPSSRAGIAAPLRNEIVYNAGSGLQETGNEYIVKIEAAGLDKGKVKVQINPNSITVSGECSSQNEEKDPDGSYSARSFSSFIRTIPVPPDADLKGVKTDIQADTLIIHIPKKVEKSKK